VPHCDIVTTTTHKTLRMTRGAIILCRKEHASKVDQAVFPRLQGGPHQANIAAIAVGLKHIATPEYGEYIRSVRANAKALAKELQSLSLNVVSGGTDNHLMLINLFPLEIDGDRASIILEDANIIVNKNKVPGDKGTAKKPFGIRLGTPAVTTRGMGKEEMRQVARWVADVVMNPDDKPMRKRIRKEVMDLCAKFPIYTMTY